MLAPASSPLTGRERRRVIAEVVLLLCVTFGMAGAHAVLSLLQVLAEGPLREHSVTLNPETSPLGWVSAVRSTLGSIRLLAWAGLGAYLLIRAGRTLRELGLGPPAGRRDAGTLAAQGVVLAALIGLPGLALYLVGHAFGLTAQVVPTSLSDAWWRPLVLTLNAVANGVAEEVIVVVWLTARLRQLGWGWGRVTAASALLRGSYHLYQGLGAGAGNLIMGVVFVAYYRRTGRAWPLIVAHVLIDVVAFVGYPLLAGRAGWLPE